MFDPVLVIIELLSTYFNLPQPSVMFDPVLVLIELLSTYFNLHQPSVMLILSVSLLSYRQANFNLSIQYDFDSLYPLELLPAFFNLSTLCDVDPVCVSIEILVIQCNVDPVCITNVLPLIILLNPVWSTITQYFGC